ncbi:hypothetical protein PMAYCL1PPCAC_05769, partial [Pristionchus mayeri]
IHGDSNEINVVIVRDVIRDRINTNCQQGFKLFVRKNNPDSAYAEYKSIVCESGELMLINEDDTRETIYGEHLVYCSGTSYG